MKKPLKHFILNAVSILILAQLLPGVSFGSSIQTLLFAALILSLMNLLIKPLLKIVLFPINVITFGLAGWLIQIIILYLTTLFVGDFTINSYSLGPLTVLGIGIPKIHFSGFWSYFGSAFVLSIVNNVLYWIL